MGFLWFLSKIEFAIFSFFFLQILRIKSRTNALKWKLKRPLNWTVFLLQKVNKFWTGLIRLKSEHDPIGERCFYSKSSKWTEPNARLTCDRNGLPSEIMTVINRREQKVMFMAFSFTLRSFTYIRRKRRMRSKKQCIEQRPCVPFPHCTWLSVAALFVVCTRRFGLRWVVRCTCPIGRCHHHTGNTPLVRIICLSRIDSK